MHQHQAQSQQQRFLAQMLAAGNGQNQLSYLFQGKDSEDDDLRDCRYEGA